jgi:hypothetical protein
MFAVTDKGAEIWISVEWGPRSGHIKGEGTVPLAAITASSLLGYDAISSAQLCLGSFSYSSLKILSRSVRLDGERCCTAIFRSPEMFDQWLGHSTTFRD